MARTPDGGQRGRKIIIATVQDECYSLPRVEAPMNTLDTLQAEELPTVALVSHDRTRSVQL